MLKSMQIIVTITQKTLLHIYKPVCRILMKFWYILQMCRGRQHNGVCINFVIID